tara:strand:- start:652 stop:1731 length:1080 start_codon:yes stop_codon:yes gene_type:complete
MGKKNKRKNKKVELPFVSVCTPTFNRRPFIPSLIKCYKHQKYPKERMEWIIVDDGTDKIEDLIKDLDIPNVKYIKLDNKITLGKKRNLMHTYCSGEIIVYMDDDDYYPPTRVSHAVEKLISNPNALAAGSSEMYIYFKNIGKMYQFGPYGANHATAGTFAFKKELLKQTRYNEEKCMAEEKEFLKGFTVPFVQLDPKHVILVFSHIHNTCDKSKLITDQNNSGFKLSDKPVSYFIKETDLYEWFTQKIDDELMQYDAGLPIYKPDVLKQLKEFEERISKRKQQNTTSITIQRKDKPPLQLNQDQIVRLLQEQQNKIKELMLQNKRLQSLCESQQDKLSELTNPNMKDHITQAANLSTFS